MEKYSITFKCGHTEKKEVYGSYKDRERKVEYMKENCVCSECYKKQLMKQDSYVRFETKVYYSSITVILYVDNFLKYKEELKSLGFSYDDIEKCYCLYTILPYSVEIVEELEKIGLKTDNEYSKFLKEKERLYKMLDLDNVEKSYSIPEILKDCYLYFNETVYGSRTKSIYIKNKKIEITDKQAAEIEDYLKSKKEFEKKFKNQIIDSMNKIRALAK